MLGPPIVAGLIVGFVARLFLLRVDFRQYPTYPHGYLTHLALGFIAAFVGAVAVPALVEKEFTAVTFLLLAATQFKDIRQQERAKLQALDQAELVPRGAGYIEGIASVFETRSYLVMAVALLTSAMVELVGLVPGVVLGASAATGAYFLRRGHTVGHIAEVEIAPLRFEGPNLYVGDIYIMNIALREARQQILEWGLAMMLTPKTENAKGVLGNVGQRQAILHDLVSVLGSRMDVAEPEFTPLARRDRKSGRMGFYLVPMVRDQEAMLAVTRQVPVLEAARGISTIRPGGKGPSRRDGDG